MHAGHIILIVLIVLTIILGTDNGWWFLATAFFTWCLIGAGRPITSDSQSDVNSVEAIRQREREHARGQEKFDRQQAIYERNKRLEIERLSTPVSKRRPGLPPVVTVNKAPATKEEIEWLRKG